MNTSFLTLESGHSSQPALRVVRALDPSVFRESMEPVGSIVVVRVVKVPYIYAHADK